MSFKRDILDPKTPLVTEFFVPPFRLITVVLLESMQTSLNLATFQLRQPEQLFQPIYFPTAHANAVIQ